MQPTVRICIPVAYDALERPILEDWGTGDLPAHLYEFGNALQRIDLFRLATLGPNTIASVVQAVREDPVASVILRRFYDTLHGFVWESSMEVQKDIRTRAYLIAIEATLKYVPPTPVAEPKETVTAEPTRRLNFRGLKSISTGTRKVP